MYRPLQDDMGKDRGCEREREKTSARERERGLILPYARPSGDACIPTLAASSGCML